ncbi:MAG: hypothetical protein F6K36_23090 [Symploca sp. SIO3C6]|uniref:Uncharacterized protein n=1 Tax=Symploca sp. SIO1C4 TaxID=2607765 RepID=A0A6B3NK92_9CYAN|nr:hypothetical protein [Symploca sp. SIO3C6]NER32037.1 hypothetical protein [Symploca sp. SIO1C4]
MLPLVCKIFKELLRKQLSNRLEFPYTLHPTPHTLPQPVTFINVAGTYYFFATVKLSPILSF